MTIIALFDPSLVYLSSHATLETRLPINLWIQSTLSKLIFRRDPLLSRGILLLLGHCSENIDNQVGGCHRSGLSRRVIRRADLHNIRTDQVQAFETLDISLQLSRRPAPRLGSSGSGGNTGVQNY